jgi:1-acyl-sn-glycerol-3-phosphate acyltransferase
MDPNVVAGLDPAALKSLLPAFLAGYIDDAPASAANRARITAWVDGWTEAEVAGVQAELLALGAEHRVYDAHPLARGLSREWCKDVLTDVVVEGVDHLAGVAGPAVVVANHLSYVDTTATDAALAWSGHAALADRLVTVAGPKVYETLFRRFASLCLSTLLVPQSSTVAADALPPRELARRARASLDAAEAAVASGRILQIYPEGTRTRSGRMEPFLRATFRYVEGRTIVPMAQWGTERIFGVDRERLTPGPYGIRYGAPIRPSDVADGKEALAAAWRALAGLLPAGMKPEVEEPLR